jgi:hypothetical protein
LPFFSVGLDLAGTTMASASGSEPAPGGPKKHADMAGLTDLGDANFPRDAEGRVYHLSVKEGEGR